MCWWCRRSHSCLYIAPLVYIRIPVTETTVSNETGKVTVNSKKLMFSYKDTETDHKYVRWNTQKITFVLHSDEFTNSYMAIQNWSTMPNEITQKNNFCSPQQKIYELLYMKTQNRSSMSNGIHRKITFVVHNKKFTNSSSHKISVSWLPNDSYIHLCGDESLYHCPKLSLWRLLLRGRYLLWQFVPRYTVWCRWYIDSL